MVYGTVMFKRAANKFGFTIMELLVVLVIIGVLSTVAITQYRSQRERVLDKEAIAALKLMQQAQRIYHIDYGDYYPIGSESANNITVIDDDLGVYLNNKSWSFTTYSGGSSGAGTSTAARAGRSWKLDIDSVDPVCSGSCL